MTVADSGAPRLTVCGAGAAGMAVAADCALKGLEVTLFDLPPFADVIRGVADKGGVEVTPDSDTTAGKTGLARLAAATTDAAVAVDRADLVMITAPAMYHDTIMDAVAPQLRDGQIVLFATGYWGSLRQARRFEGALPDVTLAESNIMPYICQMRGEAVDVGRSKRSFHVAAFPGERSDSVFEVLGHVYSQYRPAASVVETNLAAGGNPPIHVTLLIPIAGFYFDRFLGGKFYQDATGPGMRLVEGFDAERRRLSQRLGSAWFESQHEFDERAYGYKVDDLGAALRGSPHSDWYASAAYLEQVCSEDLVYSYVPMVRLGEAVGVDVSLTRGMVEVFGAMLGRDYWSEGVGLEALGLDRLDADEIREYVMTGRAPRM